MQTRQKRHRTPSAITEQRATAQAYDAAGPDYLTDADGDPTRPLDFASASSYGDREAWARIDRDLSRLLADIRAPELSLQREIADATRTLDVVHSRFASNHNRKPPTRQTAADPDRELTKLEHLFASTPAIDRATRILLVGER